MRKPGSEAPVSDAGVRLALLDADLVADEDPNGEVHEFVACVVRYPADAWRCAILETVEGATPCGHAISVTTSR
ncbi:MAG: hypothetical protein M3487_02200 [Actinomycetota bacterium]|nr:hypothetical protein [Actinomycetota bacterium]